MVLPIRCMAFVQLIRSVWSVQGSGRSWSTIRAFLKLGQALRTVPVLAVFEQALPSPQSMWSTGSFFLLVGMKFDFYNDFMIWLNFELYSLNILPNSRVLKNEFKHILDTLNMFLVVPRWYFVKTINQILHQLLWQEMWGSTIYCTQHKQPQTTLSFFLSVTKPEFISMLAGFPSSNHHISNIWKVFYITWRE